MEGWNNFSFSLAKQQTAASMLEVEWHKEVWFSGNIPKSMLSLSVKLGSFGGQNLWVMCNIPQNKGSLDVELFI